MSSRWADELAFATDLARRAGTILTDSYERIQRVDYKSKRDVVTDADYASERIAIDAIKARYPGDAILAEESGEHAGVLRDDGSHNGRTWVIDPLDGTVNYANGIPYYCVSIGLVVDDVPTVGVVLDPARDDLYAATVDGPATAGPGSSIPSTAPSTTPTGSRTTASASAWSSTTVRRSASSSIQPATTCTAPLPTGRPRWAGCRCDARRRRRFPTTSSAWP